MNQPWHHVYSLFHSITCAVWLSISTVHTAYTLTLTCCGSETKARSPDLVLSPALSSVLGPARVPGSSLCPCPALSLSLCPGSWNTSTIWHGHSSLAREAYGLRSADTHLRSKVKTVDLSVKFYRNITYLQQLKLITLFSFELKKHNTSLNLSLYTGISNKHSGRCCARWTFIPGFTRSVYNARL